MSNNMSVLGLYPQSYKLNSTITKLSKIFFCLPLFYTYFDLLDKQKERPFILSAPFVIMMTLYYINTLTMP